MYYVGIDPGLSGGITILNKEQHIIKKYVMPVIKNKKTEYDIQSIVDIFKNLKLQEELRVFLEKAHVRPISGKRACFMNGFGFGLFQGILEGLKISYELITPQKWMKELEIVSTEQKGSIKWCHRKYPNEQWTKSEHSKNPHDGLTDSACIAFYCWIKNRIE